LNPSVWRGSLVLLVKVALAGGLLTWLIFSGRLQLERLAAVPLDWRLLPLVLLVAGSMILPAVRWWWLLRIQGLREPLTKIIRLTWIGYLTALVLPGAASGDLAKGILILRHHHQARARAFSTVLADRFLGLHSLLCLGSFSLLWTAVKGEPQSAIIAIILANTVLLAGMTIALIALLEKRSRSLLLWMMPISLRSAWDESFALYRAGMPQLLGCFGLSCVSSTMTVASFSAAAMLLGQDLTWQAAFAAGPLIVIANCLPFTPGGIGLAEAVSSELIVDFGSDAGGEMMILVRIACVLITLPSIIALLVPNRSQAADDRNNFVTKSSRTLTTLKSFGAVDHA